MTEKFPLEIRWMDGIEWPPHEAPPVVLFDKDSTYADTTHRQPMVEEIRSGGPATWTDYSLAMAGDTPIQGAVRLLELLDSNHLVITLTGANVEAWPLLQKWLKTHGIAMDGAIMRPPGDHRSNGSYKVEVIRQLQAAGYDVRLFVEDWHEVAEQVRAATNVPVLEVQARYLADGTGGGI